MTEKPALLVIADDGAIRAALAANFSASDHYGKVIQAENAPSALVHMAQTQVSAIVMDENDRDCRARACASALRKAGVELPMVRLVGPAPSDPDPINLGDAVVKPARLSDIVTRLEQTPNASGDDPDAPIRIGPFLYSHENNVIYDNAPTPPIHLTEKESALLGYLAKNGNQTVSREDLLKHVWGYDGGISTHTLETYIYRLRQKLGADDIASTPLLTVPGGYLLRTGDGIDTVPAEENKFFYD